jgi:hypothetical protein
METSDKMNVQLRVIIIIIIIIISWKRFNCFTLRYTFNIFLSKLASPINTLKTQLLLRADLLLTYLKPHVDIEFTSVFLMINTIKNYNFPA